MMNRKANKGTRWILIYTALFTVIAGALFLGMLYFGKTLIQEIDGYHQHYTLLTYVGNLLRDLLGGRGFSMADFSLGQGLDVMGTLSYYGLFDPINIVAVFFREDGVEYAYALTILLRMYLVGLFFGLYIRKIRIRDAWIVAISAVAYAFSGYYLKATLRHPYFADGGIYLTLMLIGVERILENRKWLMMTLVTCVMLIANYYFAYQTTLLVIVYILIRLCFRFAEKGAKQSAGDGFTLLFSYLLGMALSAVYFIPVALSYLGNARVDAVGGYTASLFAYPIEYYRGLIVLFCAPYVIPGYWMIENFTPLALFGLIALFAPVSRKELRVSDRTDWQLRAGFLITLLFACVPLFGKVFNGMGYVVNRWGYGFAFTVCLCLAWTLPRLLNREETNYKRLIVFSLIYAFVIALASVHYAPVIPLAGAAGVVCFTLFFYLYARGAIASANAGKRILALMTVGACLVYEAAIYLPVGDQYSKGFYDQGVYADIMNETAAAAGDIGADGFYRVDTGLWDDCHQTMQNYRGTSYYWSVVPGACFRYYQGLWLPTIANASQIYGLGGSACLAAVSSVGYAVRDRNENAMVPYGFSADHTLMQGDGDVVQIYRNGYALPLGYAFSDTLSTKAYEALNPVEKQAALIRYAVTEDGFEGEVDLPVQAHDLSACVLETSGVQIDSHTLTVEKDGFVRLRVTGLPDSELYLAIELASPAMRDMDDQMYIDIETDAGNNRACIVDPAGNFAIDQKGLSVCLGYSDTGEMDCILTFSANARIDYESAVLYSLPMAYYRDAMKTLSGRALCDVSVGDDRVTGKIALATPGVLQLTIPYSTGWTATVDGERADVFPCGGMYMGIALDAGEHAIAFTYVTPGLVPGGVVSACAFAALISALIFGRRKKNSAKRTV